MNSDEGGMLSLVSRYLSSRGGKREVPVCLRVNKRKRGNKEARCELHFTDNPNVYPPWCPSCSGCDCKWITVFPNRPSGNGG
jgi:hypothetical protein